MALTVPLIKKLDHVHASITKMEDPLDDTNWMIWHERIHHIFSICGIDPYVYGKLECPDSALDPEITTTWDINDMYTQIIIMNNISKDQMVHITRLDTVHKIHCPWVGPGPVGPRVDPAQPHWARGRARLLVAWPGPHGGQGQVI